MSRSTKRWINQTLFTLVGVGALALLGVGINRVIQSDPFAEFRENTRKAEAEAPGVIMINTTLRGFQEGKLVMSAESDRVEVSRDRNIYTATHLKKGIFKENDKISWEFIADRGIWQDQVKTLALDGDIRAWNKEIDLKLKRLEYNNLSQDMTIPEEVTGKFYQGNIQASTLKLNLKTDKWSVGRVMWVGLLPSNADVPVPQSKNNPWTLTSDEPASGEKGHFTLFKATATNGEVEIRADKIEKFDATPDQPEVLIATGNVRYFGVDANMLCDRVTIFRKERRAVLEGKVNMLIKPESDKGLKPVPLEPMRPVVPEEIATDRQGPPPSKPSTDELRSLENRRKYPVRVLADRIEYWYAKGQRRAVATGAPQARQELPEGQWRMAWAPRAEWDGENDRLKLLGKAKQREVRATFSDGTQLKAETFTISTAKDSEAWSATMPQATGTIDEEDLPGTGSGSGGGNAPPVSGPIGRLRLPNRFFKA